MSLFQHIVIKKQIASHTEEVRKAYALYSAYVLKENILKLVVYDFDTEVDVTVLGHISENSLSEIESGGAALAVTRNADIPVSTVSKRKKDGVFYTPRYITTYIVENTLGRLCSDKKTKLTLDGAEYFFDRKRAKAERKKMLSFNTDLQTKRQRFRKRLSDNFTGIKLIGTLEYFDELVFKQFLIELAKQKITLSLKQQDEWEEYFHEYQSVCSNFISQIDATERIKRLTGGCMSCMD